MVVMVAILMIMALYNFKLASFSRFVICCDKFRVLEEVFHIIHGKEGGEGVGNKDDGHSFWSRAGG